MLLAGSMIKMWYHCKI